MKIISFRAWQLYIKCVAIATGCHIGNDNDSELSGTKVK